MSVAVGDADAVVGFARYLRSPMASPSSKTSSWTLRGCGMASDRRWLWI